MEGGRRCLTYTVKALFDVQLPHRRVPAEYMFDGGIGEFGDHKDEAHNNSD